MPYFANHLFLLLVHYSMLYCFIHIIIHIRYSFTDTYSITRPLPGSEDTSVHKTDKDIALQENYIKEQFLKNQIYCHQMVIKWTSEK